MKKWMIIIAILLMVPIVNADPSYADEEIQMVFDYETPPVWRLASNGDVTIGIGMYGIIYRSIDGSTWEKILVSDEKPSFDGVVWDGKQFIIYGIDYMATSKDGKRWNEIRHNLIGKIKLNGIAYQQNVYVATADFGEIYTSTDLNRWELVQETGIIFKGVTIHNNQFIAYGSEDPSHSFYPVALISTDGVHWESGEINKAGVPNGLSHGSFYSVASSGEVAVAVSTTGFYVSEDGELWNFYLPTESTVMSDNNQAYDTPFFQEIIWTGKEFVAVTTSWEIYRSEDGEHWSYEIIDVPNESTESVVFYNEKLYLSGSNGMIVEVARDGESQIVQETNINDSFVAIAKGKQQVVALTDKGRIMLSNDGVTWEKPLKIDAVETGNEFKALTFGNGIFIALREDGKIYRSTDAIQWDQTSLQGSSTTNELLFMNDQFYVFEQDQPKVYISEDGVNWSKNAYGSTYEDIVSDIRVANGTFFAIKYSEPGLFVSKDGIQWTKATIERNIELYSPIHEVIYHQGHYYAVLGSNRMLSSSDGLQWKPHYVQLDGEYVHFNDIDVVQNQFIVTAQSGYYQGNYYYMSTDFKNWERISVEKWSGFYFGQGPASQSIIMNNKVVTVDKSGKYIYVVHLDVSMDETVYERWKKDFKDIPLTKEWKITFNQPVSLKNIEKKIFVMEEETEKFYELDIQLIDKNTIAVKNKVPFKANTSYSLLLSKDLSNEDETKTLNEGIRVNFHTVKE